MLHRKLSTADILIDDHTPNLHHWEEAGGLGVKWLNEINGNNGRFEGARVGSTEELREVLDAALLPSGNLLLSSSIWTYIVDDDIVINGWYFLDGEPKLYVRDTPDTSSVAWGRNQMSRYKTYAAREWMYRYSEYTLYRELYLFTPYLATINNLGSPVIKTADKTMKITFY